VAERANDEILQLAGQGNLQALSVYLNRHLIPSGAHVKVKQKDEALHVLVVVMSESDHVGLIKAVQDLLVTLHPTHIRRVKVYTQVLGQKQASLRQQFSISSTPEPQFVKVPPVYSKVSNGAPPSTFKPTPSVTPLPGTTQQTDTSSPAPQHLSSSLPGKSAPDAPPKRRYSVADFLAQAGNIDELRVLANHPFFTGSCPHCGQVFPKSSSPPTYWDCRHCGWQDNLSPSMLGKDTSHDSGQTSLTESKRLGDYLVEAGLVTEAQVEVALADQVTTHLRFGEVLIRRGWVKKETIEYLMQKVILPERNGHENANSYLDSSRNLLKTLLKVRASSQGSNSMLLGPPTMTLETSAPAQELKQEKSKSTQNGVIPIVPPIVPPVKPAVAPKAAPFPSGKLPNERETLILPDVELDELDAYLNGS
jgi:hypothetical protein